MVESGRDNIAMNSDEMKTPYRQAEVGEDEDAFQELKGYVEW